jgi:hypothetical protein
MNFPFDFVTELKVNRGIIFWGSVIFHLVQDGDLIALAKAAIIAFLCFELNFSSNFNGV